MMSPQSDPLSVAAQAVSGAVKAGADDADAYVRQSANLEIYWRNGAPENLSRASAFGLGLRVTTEGRTVLVHTTDVARKTMSDLAAEAVAMARTLPKPSEITRYADPREISIGPHPDPELAGEPMAAKTARLRAAEEALLGVPGVSASGGVSYSESQGTVALANSHGLHLLAPFAHIELSPSAIAEGEGESYTGERHIEVPARRYLPDPAEAGRDAGRRAAGLLGARPVTSDKVPVIFTPFTGWTLLACLANPLAGDAVVQERSYLREARGQRIAGAGVTIYDDPLLPHGPASRPFDGEGTPSRRLTLIDKGIVLTYFTDLNSAAKLGLPPGGNATRGAYNAAPAIASSNFILAPGPRTPEEIIRATPRGFVVEGLSGWWVGASPVTDTYSSAAMGYWVEDGEIVHPVKGISIGGSLRAMLASIDMIADDLPTTVPTCTPTFRVAEMAVSGV
ncbi:MAG: hypothetical protein GF355_16650 [Candidatus Eisenbacteria bacterium]|nr:hypothetical protein [Candidatus Eisenbacteria bacterium]